MESLAPQSGSLLVPGCAVWAIAGDRGPRDPPRRRTVAQRAIPKPVWLWHSRVDLDAAAVDLLWQAFLRRFDIEHAFRMLEQTLGWTSLKPRDPTAGPGYYRPPTPSSASPATSPPT
ncbi:hypothetical protein ACIRRA_30165 [Nocardia sp. NPDC101769]|uniref:hypothetical protein n=1 Tax=Nocardia sp. NPDC101769 TaxID=3364333 RepID=UPI0038138260